LVGSGAPTQAKDRPEAGAVHTAPRRGTAARY
jgi:hypothetical protein